MLPAREMISPYRKSYAWTGENVHEKTALS